MFDFSNPLFREPKGSVYKICLSDSFLYEAQRAISTATCKCVPDVFSLEESSSHWNTSFHRQKGCLGLCFLDSPLHKCLCMCVYVQRERCSGCCGSLCTKSETLTVKAAEGNQCFFWSVHLSCQVTASVLSCLRLPARVVRSQRDWADSYLLFPPELGINAFVQQHHHQLSCAC